MAGKLSVGSVTFALWILAAGVARGASAPEWSDAELAQFSSAIVTGRVVDVSVGRDVQTMAIYTYVTIAVDEALKGEIPERAIVLKQLGGRIGDRGLSIGEQAVFARGEEVLVFLETRPRDRTLYTAALWQGKWTIDRDAVTGERIALRQSPEASSRGILRSPRERRALATFAARLRTPNDARPRRFVTEPPAEELHGAVSDTTPPSAAFALLGPLRWNEFDIGTPVPIDVQSGGNPSLPGGGAPELGRAQSVWSGPTGFRFAAGVVTNRCISDADQESGRISVVFLDPCGEIDDAGGTLAVGGAYFTSSGGRTVNGIAFGRATDGFIVNNGSATALRFMSSSSCFASVDTHELGHVLGLDHSTNSAAIMFPSISFTTCSAGAIPPSADDINGIRTIYPPPSLVVVTSPPGPPTGLATSASGSTISLTWTPPSTGGAPTGYLVEAGSDTGLSNLASFNTGTTETSLTTSGVPAGRYILRVKATNAMGTSPPSNESTLVVAGVCIAAPSRPTGLFVAGNSGGTVMLQWTASDGSPTTYFVEAGSVPGSTNITILDMSGTATSARFVEVKAGSYFVRVRARNACGISERSNEVFLIVP